MGHFEALIDLLLNESGDYPHTDTEAVLRGINTIIDIIAKSDIEKSGEKANQFLKRILDASSESKSKVELRPDIITFSNVIGAYIKDDNIEDAVSLLNDMMNGKDDQLKPNAFCFNKCLNYYCKHRNSEAAEDLYYTMYEIAKTDIASKKPSSVLDNLTYNMMMEMYLNMSNESMSNKKILTDRAIQLLDEMEDAYHSGMLRSLDMFPYEVVLERLQKRSAEQMRSGTSKVSYDLLMKMIQLHFDGHLKYLPDRLSFNLVLSSLAKECSIEAAEKAMVSNMYTI